jgi:hypothetical protein
VISGQIYLPVILDDNRLLFDISSVESHLKWSYASENVNEVELPTNVDEMTTTMIRNLEEKAGKNQDRWIQIVNERIILKHKEIISYLKSESGLTYKYPNLIAFKARDSTGEAPKMGEDLVEAQYSGDEGSLRPVYEAIIFEVLEFGDDLEIAPKKAYLSLSRNK